MSAECPICGGEPDAFANLEESDWTTVTTPDGTTYSIIETEIWCGTCFEPLRLKAAVHQAPGDNEVIDRLELTA